MVWASSAITSPLTAWTPMPSPAARSASPACRARPAAVTNSWLTTPSLASASATACGPSARKERARCAQPRLASWRAALTRGDRMLVISASVMAGRRAGWAAAGQHAA